MLNIKAIGMLISLCLLTANAFPALGGMMAENSARSPKFPKIEQPLLLKIGLSAGGIALISAQLWWFLGYKKQSVPKLEVPSSQSRQK